MKIRFFGAAREVTGSCTLLSLDGLKILIDCGMHQGLGSEKLNRRPFPFYPESIDFLILTHAHLDHSGLIPKLKKEGFKGRILSTHATRDLTEIILLDSAHIQEKDAQWQTKKNLRKGKDEVIQPLYTEEDVILSMSHFDPLPYGEMRDLGKGVSLRFVDSGHILGSASVELYYREGSNRKKVVFSGDVGKSGNPLINPPTPIDEADFVCVESTYGDRLHRGVDETLDELKEAIRETFKRGGNVLIPAFSVGRTQDILYFLYHFAESGELPKLNVYVDSPLAERATKVYLSHVEAINRGVDLSFLYKSTENYKLHFTRTVEESQRINSIKSGAIVIAGSGMCEGGRIRHHLKHNIWRPECSVIFTGFQARGTLGRLIVDGARKAKILGEQIVIRSKIYTIGGFSAHGDQRDLLQWLKNFKNSPFVFIVHGEEKAEREFERMVVTKLNLETRLPSYGDEYEI